jgi:aspartate/methionine/tyrosine aminotransferase
VIPGGAIRKVHDFLTVGAAAPLQAAGAAAMALPADYYTRTAEAYRERRDVLCEVLREVGFSFRVPDGAYYVLCETGALDPQRDSSAFARRVVADPGIAVVPGTSFYADPAQGAGQVRFAFPKRLETLHAAAGRLRSLPSH